MGIAVGIALSSAVNCRRPFALNTRLRLLTTDHDWERAYLINMRRFDDYIERNDMSSRKNSSHMLSLRFIGAVKDVNNV